MVRHMCKYLAQGFDSAPKPLLWFCLKCSLFLACRGAERGRGLAEVGQGMYVPGRGSGSSNRGCPASSQCPLNTTATPLQMEGFLPV